MAVADNKRYYAELMGVAARELESTRERLLDAAIAVFSEKGYDGAGVQEIARRAGLTTGAIYANFKGKADLLFSAIDARSGDELDDLLSWTRHGQTSELLAQLGSHLLDRDPDSQGGLLIEALVAARRDPDVARLVHSLLADRARAISMIVERARAEGDVDAGVSTPAMATFSLVLALGSLLFTEIALDNPDEGDWSSLIRRFVSALARKESP